MKQIIINLLAEFLGIEKEVVAKVLPLIEGEAGVLLQELLPIAEKVCLGLVSSNAPGTEKLATAIPQIEALAKQAGITAGTAAIIDAIQVVTKSLPAAPAA